MISAYSLNQQFSYNSINFKSKYKKQLDITSLKKYNNLNNMDIDMIKNTRYKKVSDNFNLESISNKFEDKIQDLPMVMDGTANRIKNYLNGKLDSQTFAKNHLEDTKLLIQRIEYGINGKEYYDAYKPEMSMIEDINKFCNKFNQNSISQKNLDENIEKIVSKYVNNKHIRNKLFIK